MSENVEKCKLSKLDGIKAGIPIAIGYFPIAMAFGILSRGADVSLYATLGFSFIVFAGASQFVAVGMITMGASAIEIIMTTLFLNFRHFLMSASLAHKIHFENNIWKPIISFFVTDESFSTASFAEGDLTSSYMISMQLVSYLSWGIGSAVGHIMGNILPPLLQQSMNIGLYAMFVALLVPELKKNHIGIILVILSGLLNSIFIFIFKLPQGWSLVFSIIVVSVMGTFIFDSKETGGENIE